MSQETVEIVRSIYEAFNQGDWDAASRKVHPDFEITLELGPNAGKHRGRDSILAIIKDEREAFATWTIEVQNVFESGDQVVALIKSHLRPKGTEAEFEIRNGHIWTIRDGIALSLRGFAHPEEALEALGLPE